MPFRKISGKGRGKYKSPSGRTFTKKQVRAYYASGGTFSKTRAKARRGK
jgi:hypothetical protein